MRQIIDYLELLHNKYFGAWFLMNNFPEGINIFNDCSIAEMVEENCNIEKAWVDDLTGYYHGVFEENDGYVENPKTIMLRLSSETLFFVEFHPGDTIYYIDGKMIGCTGPEYSIRSISFPQFIEYTKKMGNKEKIFLLPMVKAQKSEKALMSNALKSILSEFDLQKCKLDDLCNCIIENCIERT